ncbi:MAG: hypothetical protein KDD69_15685 [Bdellovibrionales bacterium]|nr:hypothetical protein [Bdellovibrionales bacterium]
MSESERISLSYQAVERKGVRPALSRALTFLVFEGHGTRVGLELSLCVIGYTVASLAVPWNTLGVPLKWATLISWFGCCFLVILLDQLLLCRSVYTFRRAYLFQLAGAFEKALSTLEEIGPESRTFIPLPASRYHLQRAEVLSHAERFGEAERELHLAELAGAQGEELHIARSRHYRLKGDLAAATEELAAAKAVFGVSAPLRLEEGLLELGRRKDLWAAKRIFQEVMEMPDSPHFAGESTHHLAKAYWNATRLWTGEAEEGLDGISRAIDRLRSAILYVDTLRPVLSQLLLERSHYFATHKEPSAAVLDLKVAMAFCTYPLLASRGETIREELLWRHAVTV